MTAKGRPNNRRPRDLIEIELKIGCRDARIAAALEQVLMPDNRYFPKDQRFQASRAGPSLRFSVVSPRVKPALGTAASLVGDAKLFQDTWVGTARNRHD